MGSNIKGVYCACVVAICTVVKFSYNESNASSSFFDEKRDDTLLTPKKVTENVPTHTSKNYFFLD